MNINQQMSTAWCGTLNNYTEEDLERMQTIFQENAAYAIIGKEIAPTTGTEHLQFYIRFKRNTRGSFLKNLFPTIHIEKTRGSEKQNIDYCSKEGEYWETGEPKKYIQKELNRAKKVKEMTGDYMKLPYYEFRDKYPWEALHLKTKLEQWRIDSLACKEPWGGRLKDKNYWIWGPPGTGKSKWARSQREPANIFLKGVNKWWSGYIDGVHKLILFEDWPKDAKFMAGLMKVWADRYTFTAETKGGTLFIDPSNWALIVTSNYSMRDCFEFEDYEALERRFTEVHIENPNDIFLFSKIAFE